MQGTSGSGFLRESGGTTAAETLPEQKAQKARGG